MNVARVIEIELLISIPGVRGFWKGAVFSKISGQAQIIFMSELGHSHEWF
jgi:hypothetical protein